MILLTDKIKSDVPRGFYYFEKKAYLYTAAFWNETSLLLALQEYCKQTIYTNVFNLNDCIKETH